MLKWLLRLCVLAFAFGGAVFFAYYVHSSPYVQQIVLSGGYVSIFAFSFINGFNVVVPFITASLIPALVGAGLSAPLLILLITLGMTLADMVSFVFGTMAARASRLVESAVLRRMEHIERLPTWAVMPVVFGWATLSPMPNEVILFPLGFLGYHWYKIMPLVFIGNGIFNTVVGYGLMGVLAQFI